jgi:NADH-quinone oxidoreductase subunit N
VIAETLTGPPIAWFDISPLLILLGAALVLLVVGSLTPSWPRGLYAAFTATAAGATMVMAFVLWDDVTDQGARTLVGDAVVLDAFSMFATIAIAASVFLACLVTDDYLRREQMDGPEVYALYLTAAIGGVTMAMANDLIVLFLGLESQEAGIKYFVLGGFASAFFLYGIALIYGGTGNTRYDQIVDAVNDVVPTQRNDALVLAGVALLLVGLAFKVSAVPFHFWTPDVYQGAPTPVTAFMASAGKIGAFAAMLRVLTQALPNWRDDWRPVVWVIAVATLVIGSILAVVQTNVKRMLAYSSISHAGFILVGVEAAGHAAGEADPGRGVSASMLYLLLYAVLVMGTFAIVTVVGRTGDSQTDLAAFRGLGRTRPALALAMTVLLLAQAGVPLTSGFVAKFGVIEAAVDERSYAIAIIAMLASVIAAFLYLRIMISMWITDAEVGDDAREQVRVPLSSGIAIVLAVGFTILVGIAPGWIISAAENATTIARTALP